MTIRAFPPDGALEPSFGGRIVPASGLEVTGAEAEELRLSGWRIEGADDNPRDAELPAVVDRVAVPAPAPVPTTTSTGRTTIPSTPPPILTPAVPTVTNPPGKRRGES